jgi:putative addiction module component (TIGR02574 family)
MSKPETAELLELPVGERVRIAQVLWDSVAASQGAYPISGAERRELDRRLEEYDRNPSAGSSWGEVKRRITGAN